MALRELEDARADAKPFERALAVAIASTAVAPALVFVGVLVRSWLVALTIAGSIAAGILLIAASILFYQCFNDAYTTDIRGSRLLHYRRLVTRAQRNLDDAAEAVVKS